MALTKDDLDFAVLVLKARYVAPRANANLVAWHETDQVRIDWLGKKLKAMGAGYEPALVGGKMLIGIAKGDPAQLLPLDAIDRALVGRLIEEIGDVARSTLQ